VYKIGIYAGFAIANDYIYYLAIVP